MIGIMNNLSGILNIACAISVQFPFFNADYDVKLVNRTDAWRRNGGMSCQIYMLSLYIYHYHYHYHSHSHYRYSNDNNNNNNNNDNNNNNNNNNNSNNNSNNNTHTRIYIYINVISYYIAECSF